MNLTANYYASIKKHAAILAGSDHKIIAREDDTSLYFRAAIFRCETPACSFAVPGIYEWKIAESTPYLGRNEWIYVGKFTHADRPLTRYAKNCRDLLTNQRWHNSTAEEFRPVHHVLTNAILDGKTINLRVIDNPVRGRLASTERELIKSCNANLNSACLTADQRTDLEQELEKAALARSEKLKS